MIDFGVISKFHSYTLFFSILIAGFLVFFIQNSRYYSECLKLKVFSGFQVFWKSCFKTVK